MRFASSDRIGAGRIDPDRCNEALFSATARKGRLPVSADRAASSKPKCHCRRSRLPPTTLLSFLTISLAGTCWLADVSPRVVLQTMVWFFGVVRSWIG